MTRAEHLAWAKTRALEYVEGGDLVGAVASMVSDLGKHPQIGCSPFLAYVGQLDAARGDGPAVTRWIQGFN